MSQSQFMLSNERKVVAVSILDKGGEVIQDSDQLPAGWKVSFESSNPDVVGIAVRGDGLTADLSSDNIGTSTITISTTRPDGSHLKDSPDVTELEVRAAEPDAQNVTFSEALPEDSPAPARGSVRGPARKLTQAEAIAEREAVRKEGFNARNEADAKAKAEDKASRNAEGLGSFGPDAEADAKAKAAMKARLESRDHL